MMMHISTSPTFTYYVYMERTAICYLFTLKIEVGPVVISISFVQISKVSILKINMAHVT